MNKIKSLIISAVFIMIMFANIAYSDDSETVIRAGISDTNFKTYLFDSVEFIDLENVRVTDSVTGYEVKYDKLPEKIKVTSENNLFRIYVDGVLVARNLTGPILVIPEFNKSVSIGGLKRKGKQAKYRGYIELIRSSKDNSKFSIVNVLSLKNYLRGVVPNEMPVKFGLEALKAQTVAARNYAIAPRTKAYTEFDVCDSVACQVYFGSDTESELSDKAIEETNGIIALDKENNPILALYSSTAGGYTESYENVFSDPKTKEFPPKEIHYLTAVPDKEEFVSLEKNEDAEKFYMSSPESFDDRSPYYRWTKEWTKDELEKVLSKTLVSQSSTGFVSPCLADSEDFGKLKSVKVIKRGKSGKVIKLEITTNKNTFTIEKELVIRRCFQKNSVSLPSANFIIKNPEDENGSYKFIGGGFGHGCGLSQWGAGKMAQTGYTFDEILKHYYKDIKLTTVPFKMPANGKYKDDEFYTDSKFASVFVDNRNCADKIIICINGKEVINKLHYGENEINISNYIRKGLNKISYLTEGSEVNNNGETVVYVEMYGKENEKEKKTNTDVTLFDF